MRTLEALILAAIARIRTETDRAFRDELDAPSAETQRERHAYALGLGRAIEILKDFLDL